MPYGKFPSLKRNDVVNYPAMGKKKQARLAEANERSEAVTAPEPEVVEEAPEEVEEAPAEEEEFRTYSWEAACWFIRKGTTERSEEGPPPEGELPPFGFVPAALSAVEVVEAAPAEPEHTPQGESAQVSQARVEAPRRRGNRGFVLPPAAPLDAMSIGVAADWHLSVNQAELVLERAIWKRGEAFNGLLKTRQFTLDQLSSMFGIARSTLYKQVKNFRDDPEKFLEKI